jgi:SAM-dependent methyltransferase
MRVLQRIKNLVLFVRQRGLVQTARYARVRLSESYHERHLGVRTAGRVSLAELGITNPDSALYVPSDYASIYRAFRHLTIEPDRDVFLDFGSGLGRVVIVAATFPFRKVSGVELSPQLTDLARENVRRARPRLKCPDVHLVTADAASYLVPPEVTVISFYNPFVGPVLASALASIRQSLRQAPRKLTVVFKNP